MPAADYAGMEAYDRVVGLPDPNAFQAHICQYLSGARRTKLEDFLLVPFAARRPVERLSAEESAGMMGAHLSGGT